MNPRMIALKSIPFLSRRFEAVNLSLLNLMKKFLNLIPLLIALADLYHEH